MNRAQALAHEPDGMGLRWMVAALIRPISPPPLREPSFTSEFSKWVYSELRLQDTAIGVGSLYANAPAKWRSPEYHRQISGVLSQFERLGYASRTGQSGSYRWRIVR